MQSNGVSSTSVIRRDRDWRLRRSNLSPRVWGHARLIRESDDDAFGTLARRESDLQRGGHSGFPVWVANESRYAKASDRGLGLGTEVVRKGDSGRPGDDDEGADL